MKPEDFVQTAAFRAASHSLSAMVELGRQLIEHHRDDGNGAGIALACAFQLFVAEKVAADLSAYRGELEPLLKLFREGFAFAESRANEESGDVH